MSRTDGRFLVLATVVVLLGFVPVFAGPFYTTQGTRILVYAIFGMSLDLLVGYAGLVSLGHAAFFGIAAYTTAMLAQKAGILSVWLILPASLAAAAIAALVIGAFSLRASGVYFIMVTLAFAQVVFFVVHDMRVFGGSDGILLDQAPRLELFGNQRLDLGNKAQRFYAALGLAALVFLGLGRLTESLFGRVLAGIKSNERRMRALGFPVFRYKLVAFVIAGTLAGLAGFLNVCLTSQADPSIVDWLHSAQLLVMVILGGLGTLYGAAIGAFVLIVFIDQVSELTTHWKLAVGVMVVAITLLAPGGIVGIGRRFGQAAGLGKEAV
jgi:branched-chain amino acid transport system permease protein